MAKNEKKGGKPASKDFDAKRSTEAKEAKQKLRAAEKAKSPDAKKAGADKAGKAKSKKARRFWKDFRGELKKIIWPDFKTVMKNTGIVLLVTVIIGAMVWILDFALNRSVRGLKSLAQGVRAEQTAPDFGDYELPKTTIPAEETTAGAEGEAETEPVAEPATEDEHAGHNHD